MVSKFLIASVAIILLAGLASARPHEEDHERVKRQIPGVPREFQNINIENYLRNARAVQFQLKCVIYDGPCDTIGKYLKRNIPIWLRTQCKNCNDEQKQQAGKLINFFQENYSKEWDDAIAKYGKGAFTDEEIANFENELGVKIMRDPNAPRPSGKPDSNALANLAKESIAILKATKEPLIIGSKDSSTTISVVLPADSSTTAKP